MHYNQELGLRIEFGPARVDSVRRGGGLPPPWIKSLLRRFTPSWTSTRVTCDCLLPFVHPLKSFLVGGADRTRRFPSAGGLAVAADDPEPKIGARPLEWLDARSGLPPQACTSCELTQ